MATWCHGNCVARLGKTADAAGTVAAGVLVEDFLTIFLIEFSNCDQVDKRSCLFETV